MGAWQVERSQNLAQEVFNTEPPQKKRVLEACKKTPSTWLTGKTWESGGDHAEVHWRRRVVWLVVQKVKDESEDELQFSRLPGILVYLANKSAFELPRVSEASGLGVESAGAIPQMSCESLSVARSVILPTARATQVRTWTSLSSQRVVHSSNVFTSLCSRERLACLREESSWFGPSSISAARCTRKVRTLRRRHVALLSVLLFVHLDALPSRCFCEAAAAKHGCCRDFCQANRCLAGSGKMLFDHFKVSD